MRTRVKICGVTRSQDAELAAKNGADAIGLVFYRPSPRAVTVAQAENIIGDLPPFVSSVGLFVDAKAAEVKEAISRLSLDLLQFHGDESAAYCEQFNMPYIKAVRMHQGINLQAVASIYENANGLLLDSYQQGVPGGTGQIFDWTMIPHINMPLILAGGLNPENVAGAIRQVHPYAVDVSGGVEQSKGIKSSDKIRAFMQEVANA